MKEIFNKNHLNKQVNSEWEIILNSNWNKLFIKEFKENKDENSLKEIWNNIFNKEKNIDSIIFLIKINDILYNFIVYERDKTFSTFCWNWAWASLYFLNKKYWIDEILLTNKEWWESNVKIKEENIEIKMWEVNDISNIDTILNLQEKILNCKEDLKYYIENPNELQLITKDENKTIFFLSIFKNLENDKDFINFIKGIKIKTISEISWEPHVILEIKENNLSNFLIDYYLKAISFIIRSKEAIYSDINYMFYYFDKENNKYKMLSSERWVNNEINYDQTLSCWTGSSCLGKYIMEKEKENKNDISIMNRSWKQLNIHNKNWNISLIYPKDNINIIKNNKKAEKSFFPSKWIHYNLRYKLEKNWIQTENMDYNSILNKHNDNLPKISKDINEQFWNTMISSCFHEGEFPIDPYKISSSINWAYLAELLWIDKIESPYLDTLNKELKKYPNINTKNWKVFNKAKTIIDTLSKHTKDISWIKDIIRYLNQRHNNDNFEKIQNEEIKKSLNELEGIFKILVWEINPNDTSSEYWKFILDISKKTWLYDEIKSTINANDKDLNKFLVNIIWIKIKRNINEMYSFFIRQLLKLDINTLESTNIKKIINKALQDSVITSYIEKNLDKESSNLLKEKWILNKKWIFEPKLSSLDEEFKIKLTNSLKIILNDKDFWESFLKDYFKKLAIQKTNKSLLIWEFNDSQNEIKNINLYFQIKENNENSFYIWSGKENANISDKYALNLITNPNNIINYQGSLVMLILSLWNIAMIWSERWYRESVSWLLREKNKEKFNNLADFIDILKLTDDYIPEKQLKWDKNDFYYNFPSWTDNSYLWDLFEETLIWWWDFWKDQLNKLLNNNFSKKTLNVKEQTQFIKELINKIDSENNFSRIYEILFKKEISELEKSNNPNKLESWKKRYEEMKESIDYKWDEINNLILSLFNKYLLLTKIQWKII